MHTMPEPGGNARLISCNQRGGRGQEWFLSITWGWILAIADSGSKVSLNAVLFAQVTFCISSQCCCVQTLKGKRLYGVPLFLQIREQMALNPRYHKKASGWLPCRNCNLFIQHIILDPWCIILPTSFRTKLFISGIWGLQYINLPNSKFLIPCCMDRKVFLVW